MTGAAHIHDLVRQLHSAPLLPILRSSTGHRIELVARALLDAGLPVIELTLTPGCLQITRRLSDEYGPQRLGVGTVMSLTMQWGRWKQAPASW